MAPPADVSCAENVAFLHLLHKVPVSPSRNKTGRILLRHEHYTLSFDRERQFVGVCAFLSCIRADMKRVPAVCLQEVPETQSLNLLIAVNKREFDEGKEYLREMKAGFQRVFQELRRVETANGIDVQGAVFEAVIEMCSERIRQRLGLQSTNGKPGKPMRDTLQLVINDVRRFQPTVTDFIHRARHVLRLIDAWSKHRVVPRLGDIVDSLHDFTQSPAWSLFIASIPTLKLQSSQLNKLVREMGKLASYRDAATYLYRTAKRYPIARLVRAVVVELPRTMFERTPPQSYIANLESVFEHVRVKKQNLDKVCSLLGKDTLDVKLSFESLTRLIRKESGIHSEVQLLVYCDNHLRGLKPRVICSSKKACFLCNLLLNTHGKIYTPYSHGRLHPRWRMPKMHDSQLTKQLNDALREFSRQSLGQMKKTDGRIKHPIPEESADHTLILSSSTLAESSSSQEKEVTFPSAQATAAATAGPSNLWNLDTVANGAGVPDTGNLQPSASYRNFSPGKDPSTSPIAPDVAKTGECTSSEEGHLRQRNARIMSIGTHGSHILRPGKTISTRLTPGLDNSELFIADNFDLLVDRDTASTIPSSAGAFAERCTCKITWLTTEEARCVLAKTGSSVVDVDASIQVSLSMDRCKPKTFFLSDGGCVLRVSVDKGRE